VLIHYPATWGLPFAIAAGLVLIGVFVLGWRRGRLTLPRLALGAGAHLLAVVLAVTMVTVLWWLVFELQASRQVVVGAMNAHLYLAGFLALTLGTAGAFQLLLRRKVGTANLAGGALGVWWILALLSSLYLPGFSYLFSWPLLFAALALGWTVWRPAEEGSSWGGIAVLTAGAAPAAVLFPSVVHDFFHFAQPSPGNPGSQSPMGIGVAILFVAMLLALLVPYLELVGSKFGWRLLALVAVLFLICIVAGALTPGIPYEDLGLGDLDRATFPHLPTAFTCAKLCLPSPPDTGDTACPRPA
jgi:hypothetical protein